jgi:hypothetical protein
VFLWVVLGVLGGIRGFLGVLMGCFGVLGGFRRVCVFLWVFWAL